MGLTERHLFENEDVPEKYEWALEDAVYNSRTNKKEEFNAKEAQEMIDLWLKDDAPEWIRTRMMSMLYEQWQYKNISKFVQQNGGINDD